MIISKTPVRIPIGGGGTDLPSYYEKFGSFFISAAIDKYIYIVVQEHKWEQEFIVKYSKTEKVKKVSQIKNEIVRECLKLLNITQPMEIVSISDVGGQTGLGSSGSFCVGLLNALYAFKGETASPSKLARQACKVAIDILGLPSGKQDEYIAAYGGFRSFGINQEGKVKVLKGFDTNFIRELDRYLYMFHTGIKRKSKFILEKQKNETKKNNKQTIDNLHQTQKLGFEIRDALKKRDVSSFGKLLDKHWQLKRERTGVTNPQLDKWYEVAKKNGAVGGKIMGAGGGGFFLFYCEEKPQQLIESLTKVGLRHIPFSFLFHGSKVVADL